MTLAPSTPIEHLGEAIADLAARIHAATYELLVMLREFDEQSGWNNGFLSCAIGSTGGRASTWARHGRRCASPRRSPVCRC
jgi:hypothetical protein